jgi:hypothetical protein
MAAGSLVPKGVLFSVCGLASAARRLVHHLVVALGEVQGLQDVEIVLIDDVAFAFLAS